MSEDISRAIEGTPQKAVIQIMWDPQTGALAVNYPVNEVVCRFMFDKARAFLDDEWRKRNAPMITPANGHALPRVNLG